MSAILGGIGLFVLGMLLLSENLQAAASNAMRGIMQRLAGNPYLGVLSGATATAILQSSSATILITIGFVNAGIVNVSQSLGLIYGANIGTTSTAWIVSLAGFHLNITAMVLPLVAVGAALRLFGRGKWKNIGLACAGFSLIFLGIDFLQSGMADYADKIDLARFAGDGWIGRFWLLVIGVVMTVLLQS